MPLMSVPIATSVPPTRSTSRRYACAQDYAEPAASLATWAAQETGSGCETEGRSGVPSASKNSRRRNAFSR
jgi:hypothetical protein